MPIERKETIDSLKEQLKFHGKLHHSEREWLADGTSRLTLLEIMRSPSAYKDDKKLTVALVNDAVRWPIEASCSECEPGHTFVGEDADTQFRQVVMDTTNDGIGGFRLGNFLKMFQQDPTLDATHISHPIEKVYATKPALLRLFAIDPGLVADVGEIVHGKPPNQLDWAEYLQQFDEVAVDGGVSNIALTTIRQAYMTIYRLVREDDTASHNKLLGIDTPDEAEAKPKLVSNIELHLTK